MDCPDLTRHTVVCPQETFSAGDWAEVAEIIEAYLDDDRPGMGEAAARVLIDITLVVIMVVLVVTGT
jgi:hypothetical protein